MSGFSRTLHISARIKSEVPPDHHVDPFAEGTTVSWAQTFDSADVASRIEHIVVPANEQNLDRLSDEVMGGLAR